MADILKKNTIDVSTRQKFLQAFPCFASLAPDQSAELALLMEEVSYAEQEQIVKEDDLVDSIYIIVNGEAEVTRLSKHRYKVVQTPIAILNSGESIGLNDTGFYSPSGKRTATVTAITNVLLLKLSIKDLYIFLKQHHLEETMYNEALQMMRVNFIKQALPFSKLSYDRLRWLANHVEDLHVEAVEILFNQGDEGDKCYLIRNGQIEILMTDENNIERQIALLKPPAIFGEATLITHSPRNATARALQDTELLVLPHQHLYELIESEDNVTNTFMSLMVDRSRPLQNKNVSMHKRISADGQDITILKNPISHHYFKLSVEGAFIWQQLDGKQTLQDITLNLADQFHVFAPDTVVALISKLNNAGFLDNLELNMKEKTSYSLLMRVIKGIKKILEIRLAFGDADQWITQFYNCCGRYLFTITAQVLLAILAIIGFLTFINYTNDVLLFFSVKHASLLLLLVLIPFGLVEAVLHELGHAFAVKAFDREVHYIGVGWYWFSPIAFTDTSDMWLATRKPRMLVNFAGIYVDILVAGLSAFFLLFIANPYIQGMLWLFAMYTYIRAFRMLSPLQEMDGYYILMDWVEKTRLRHASVAWLVKTFPKSIKNPKLFKEHWPEVIYWLTCIAYLILITLVTLLIQTFIFIIFGIEPANPYLVLILPFLVVLFSCLSIIVDIRNQTE